MLNTLAPGEYFGEMMLDGGLRSASVMSLEPCRLGILARERFRAFLGTHPDSALALIRHLIRRTRALTENVKDLALLDVYGRLAKLLLSLARDEDGAVGRRRAPDPAGDGRTHRRLARNDQPLPRRPQGRRRPRRGRRPPDHPPQAAATLVKRPPPSERTANTEVRLN